MSEISISSTSTEQNKTGSWKYIRPEYRDRGAPCVEKCPTGVEIERYMTLLRERRVSDAAELLLRDNPIPSVTGRVCNHPCEDGCNRANFDGAVAIHSVERMLGDLVLQEPLPLPLHPIHAERVAVIGSGPAGLACAYHLTRLGYAVDVFEQYDQPGGMLRVGIPEYRLPRAVLDRAIERITALGVTIHCGKRLGENLDWKKLLASFAAVFVGTGAHVSKKLEATLPKASYWSGLDFLRAVNRGDFPSVGKKVFVIGGGNTAMDCARTALRLGAEVTVVYRRTRAEMPAIKEEVDDAEREGVQFIFKTAPGDAAFPDGADTIITAIGENPELELLHEDKRVFSGGDVAGDDRTVASALGAGKRAAYAIDGFLRDMVHPKHSMDDVVPFNDINVNHFERVARHDDRRTDHVLPFAETNLGLSDVDALNEAARCFQCGDCNDCEKCMLYCSDVAIHRSTVTGDLEIDLAYCKGCGVCATECPRGAIVMTREN